MSRTPAFGRPHVPAVEPALLASAIFLFREHLATLDADDEADETAPSGIDTSAVLDLFAEELGTSVPATLALYMRVTALYRLLAASPSLARLAIDEAATDGALTEDAILAASRLDLHVTRNGAGGAADFDPREFRDALSAL